MQIAVAPIGAASTSGTVLRVGTEGVYRGRLTAGVDSLVVEWSVVLNGRGLVVVCRTVVDKVGGDVVVAEAMPTSSSAVGEAAAGDASSGVAGGVVADGGACPVIPMIAATTAQLAKAIRAGRLWI
ncbi:MAG: hypothetical protein QG597_185 [Actinomycetota bacterium]|nr:hypothetical protein [Actinomycetota bacterium]